MATIKDVAERAGVSKGTVSNVFSGKRPISKEVRERVIQAARELNYKANYFARSLAIQRTKIIGLSMVKWDTAFSPFHMALLNGVLNECIEHGYRLLVNKLTDDRHKKYEFAESDPIEGEIILDPSESDQRLKARQEQGVLLVSIGRPSRLSESAVSYVDNNNLEMAWQATHYLLEMGHRHILFLNALRDRPFSREREEGYKKALHEFGIPFRQDRVKNKKKETPAREFAAESMLELFRTDPAVTAVITDSDQMALGVYRAAEKCGIRIPERLSVLSFCNDVASVDHFTPSLTFVNLNAELLGKEAAKVLLDQLEAEDRVVKRVIVPATLIERSSCQSPTNL